MQRTFSLFGLFLAFFLLTAPAVHAARTIPAKASLVAEEVAIQANRPFTVAIRVEMEKGWHTYWKNPGATGFPIEVVWDLPEGFRVSGLKWPYPDREESALGVNYIYHDDFWVLAEVMPPKRLDPLEESTIGARVDYLICSSDNCVPGDQSLALTLPHTESLPGESPWHEQFQEKKGKIPTKFDQLSVVKRDKGKLTVQIPSAFAQDFEEAYFCPEKRECIDEVEPLILGKDGTFKISVEADEELIAGTLVLKGKNGSQALDVVIPTSESAEIAMADRKASRSGSSHALGGSFLLALGFAFLGGLILNAMPCVLPVITLKIFSFVKMAGESRKHLMMHALLYTFGILLSFWALAAVLLILKSSGHGVGWGFQLQEPLFVAALAALIFVFALSLFGVVEIGTGFASWAGQVDQTKERDHWIAPILSGMLATAVATPCTGPFLGSAVGFAATLPAIGALAIFTALGLGLASPYVLVAAFPGVQKVLPKPGAWMVTFKEILGFCMLATALWLIWVFGAQTGLNSLIILMAALFFMSVSCWILGKWGSPVRKKLIRNIGRIMALGVFGLGVTLLVFSARLAPLEILEGGGLIALAEEAEGAQKWIRFSPERVKQYREEGKVVFIDFTAKWCLTCQANHMVLSNGAVSEKFQELGVVTMLADWTKRNPMITKELEKFGRNSVPLYVLYPKGLDSEPILLPQLLTSGIVLEALDQI